MNTISQAEKLDLLLVLALAFEKKLQSAEPAAEQTAAWLAEKSFTGLSDKDQEALRRRAAALDLLPTEKRLLWQKAWLDKIRRRGHTARLDGNMNAAHIAKVLDQEPKMIQLLILKNLPADLSRRIAHYLEINSAPESFTAAPSKNGRPVSSEIIELVRQRFLSNFVALEDIYEPTEIDRFSVVNLSKFIHYLGVRETAIACRGISSKETLAVFLGRFAEEDAKEIAAHITTLEKIRPFWVAQADRLVRETWDAEGKSDQLLRRLGLKLLAAIFVARDEMSRRYAAQKLEPRESKKWLKLVREGEKEYLGASEGEKAKADKRQKIIERLVAEFRRINNLSQTVKI